jgi:hypothetical protein
MDGVRRRILFAATAILISVAVSLWIAGVFAGAGEDTPHRIVLYTAADETLPAILNTSEADITTVRSEADLREAGDGTTRAILLTPSTAQEVDPVWLQEQFGRGMVLGGINVPQAALGQLVYLGALPGLPDDTTPLLDDGSHFGGQPFFSLVYSVSRDGRGARSGMSDELRSSKVFFAHVDAYVSEASPWLKAP